MKLLVSPHLRELVLPPQKAIEKWVRHRLGKIDHERRVRHIAFRLFDLTAPLHQLRRSDRRLLGLAAMVHDVGRSIDDETHPRQGAKLLKRATHLPISARERRALIYLTRYHRGPVPEHRMDKILKKGDRPRAMRLLLALLRAADGLDSRRRRSPHLVFALHEHRLHIMCYLEDGSEEAGKVYGRRKKFRLLEDLLACRVDFQIIPAQALELVG